jgi:phosphatidylglycerol---prolipoprotein diacylglyceryl transferase
MLNLTPSPILLTLGPIQIHWYGFLIFVAFWLAFFISLKRAKKYNLTKDNIYDLSFWLFIAGLIGARLYHVFSEISYYWKNPLSALFFWQGGLGIYGAVAGGILVIFWWTKKHQKSFLSLLDFYAPLIILGLAIGRWGNFFNQEIYGLPTNQSWGIFISPENRLAGYENFSYFHPLFFYESIFCFLLFTFLLVKEKYKKFNGQVVSLTAIFYPLFRFFIEMLRIDYQPIILGWRLGNWTSFLIFGLAVTFLIWQKRKRD